MMTVLGKRHESRQLDVHPERRRSRVLLGWLLLAGVAAFALGGCSDSDDGDGSTDSTGAVVAVPDDADTLSVGELLDRDGQGDSGANVVVVAMLVDDGTGVRMCESLAESDPPQCGGSSVEVLNPDAIDVEFNESDGVRWLDNPIQLFGWMEGDAFYVS
jgi:hypothetical protein